MAEIFKAKLRKVGNSIGIIIPNDILQDIGGNNGDIIHVAIPTSGLETRNSQLLALAGIDSRKPGFKRDKKDRY